MSSIQIADLRAWIKTETRSSLTVALNDLPQAPMGWSFFCKEKELARGPVGGAYLGRRLVAFRARSGVVSILDGSCQHLRADLSQGRVVGDCLECPYHHWQFATDGRCVEIPQSASIPAFARQRSYPAQLRNGLVFLWNGPRAIYPLPFYNGLEPDDCVCAGPLTFVLECPWYIVGANGFDFQHLRTIHERELLASPQVWKEGEFALASRTVSRIGRGNWYDLLVRLSAGTEARMTAINWSGSLVLVSVELGRLYLIGRFLTGDATLLNGVRGGQLNLIEADRELAGYFQWLGRSAHGLQASGSSL